MKRCSLCNLLGHNRRSCHSTGVNQEIALHNKGDSEHHSNGEVDNFESDKVTRMFICSLCCIFTLTWRRSYNNN
eukprot:764360-Hanusia_phi.AAC.3